MRITTLHYLSMPLALSLLLLAPSLRAADDVFAETSSIDSDPFFEDLPRQSNRARVNEATPLPQALPESQPAPQAEVTGHSSTAQISVESAEANQTPPPNQYEPVDSDWLEASVVLRLTADDQPVDKINILSVEQDNDPIVVKVLIDDQRVVILEIEREIP